MLPPHRPFREKPTPKVIIKKKSKALTKMAPADKSDGEKSLKRGLVVLSETAPAETAGR